ncbi:MAG: metallophosphoesterase [Endomicrobiaceae bacterium]|nr:metallophosphoesterase [Endomicrobiaceae bacterium]
MKKIVSVLVSVFVLYSFVAVDTIQAFGISNLNMADPDVLKINQSLGNVSNSFISEKQDKLIVYIQDLHANPSVQKNIAKIIDNLDKNYGVDKILVEGAPFSKLDTGIIDAVKEYNLSNLLLNDGILSGTEYYLANYNKNTPVYGLENWDTYLSNVKRAGNILAEKEYNRKVFDKFEKEIHSKLKKSKKLLPYIDFDVSNPVLIGELKQPILKYDALYNYVELSQQILEIDKNKVQKELEECLKDLKNTLTFESYKNLISKLQQSDYYHYYLKLSQQIADNNELAIKYRNLFQFLRYYLAQKNINKYSVVNQKNQYFQDYLNSLEDEKSKYDELFVLKMTQLFKAFLNLNISEQEYIFFVNNYDRYINLIDKKIPGIQAEYDEIFDTNEILKYHKVNIDRTKIFFENISALFENKSDNSKKITVVVSGGFHSSLLECLKAKNISCLMITPEISENTKDNNYDRILLSTINNDFQDQALANILFILVKSPVIPQQTKYFFSKQLVSNLIKIYKTDNPESIRQMLFSVAEKYSMQIDVEYNKSEFIVFIDKNKNIFKINDGKIDLKSSTYVKSADISLKSKIIAKIKQFFSIEQSLFMELNSKYRGVISRRSDGNASFNWAQINHFLKKKDEVYKHIVDFGNALLGSGNAKKYEGVEIKKFDSKGKVELNEDGTPKILKKINVIIEGDLNKYITDELIQDIFDEIMKDFENDEVSNIRDTIVIGILSKSQTLFSDHVNSGFVGVNHAIFDITDEDVLKAFLYAGLTHEFTHEFSPKKVSEEELLLNDVKYIRHSVAQILDPNISEEHYPEFFNEQIINRIFNATSGIFPKKSRFFNKIKNYKNSIEDIASIFNRNDKGYLTEKDGLRYGQWQHAYQEYLKNKSDNQEKFFSLLVHSDNSKNIDMMDYLRQKEEGLKVGKVDSRIQNILFGVSSDEEQLSENENGDVVESLKQILTSAGIDEGIQEEIMDEFKKNIYECMELLYKRMPRYAFYRFYTDQTSVHEHGLGHCLDVLAYSIKIIGRSGDVNKLISSSTDDKISIKELVYSVFMHDLSCVFFRDNHEKNSAVWSRAILEGVEDEEMINAVYNDCLGHKKIEMDRSLIGCILHDADALSATLNMKRILNIWLNQDNYLMDKRLSINERIAKIKAGMYLYQDGGDGVNDLLRHYLRSDPARYKTIGGASIIKTRFDDMYVVRNFLEAQREYIKTKNNKQGNKFTDRDVDEAIEVVNEIMTIEFEGYDKQEGKPIIVQNESLFTFKIKMKILWQIIKYKIFKQDMYFNRNIVFSDIHGGYTRFLELMYQMLASSRDLKISNYFELLHNGKDQNGYEISDAEIRRMQSEIETDILNKWNVRGNKSTLYILGDILDRGPKQVETFMFVKKLAESGRVKYVIGNHDLFASMNLFGMHLPITDKFKGIPKDYVIPEGYINKTKVNIYQDWYHRVTNIRDVTRSKDMSYWLQVFAQRTKYSTNRQNEVWNEELAKISTEFKKSFGFAQHNSVKNILSNTDKNIFGLDENQAMLEFNKAFFGIKFDTEISTGMRDVEQMAVNWWINKLEEAKELKDQYQEYGSYWDNVIEVIEKVIEEQKKKYQYEINNGNWGWAVIDAMMYRTYESMEWYAYDYIKHKGWGEALLSQINSYLDFKKGSELNKKLNDKFINFAVNKDVKKSEIMDIIVQMEHLGISQAYTNYLTKKLDMAVKVQNQEEIDRITNLIDTKISRYNRLTGSEKSFVKRELCDLVIQLDSLGMPQITVEDLLKKILELPDNERAGRQKLVDENIKNLLQELLIYSNLDKNNRMIAEMRLNAIMQKLEELNVSKSLLDYLNGKIALVIFTADEKITFINQTIKTYNDLSQSQKDSAKAMMWMLLLELENERLPQTITEEVATRIKALPLTEFEKSQKSKMNMIDDVSYFNNEEMKSIIDFFKNNFALYRIDEYGFYYMHAPLPYDEYGDVSIGRVAEDGKFEEFDAKGKRIKGFYYKGVHYTGEKIWDGFSKIAKDIKEYDIDKDDQSEIFEALALINAIYADNTTRIKPEYIAKYSINFTMEEMNKNIGMGTVIQGHNPKDKLAKNGITSFALDQEGKPVAIFVDGNMSPAYAKTRGAGSYVEISPQGIYSVGFPSGEATVTVGLEDKINEDDVIKSIISNIAGSFKSVNFIFNISIKIINSAKKLHELFNPKLIKTTNTTMLKVVDKITSDKDIVERLNYNGINAIGIVFKDDFEKNILNLIEPVVREKSVKGTEIERLNIDGVEVIIEFVTIKIANNTLKVLSMDYDKTKLTEELLVQYLIRQISKKKNNKYSQYIGKKRNILLAVAYQQNQNEYRMYEEIKSKNGSLLFNKVINKSFNIIPFIYDIRKENPIGEFIDDFDKNLSFDIIENMLSAA